ncbi:MAG: DNA internalization-related competence protein ComEC/Rec2 [Thermaerobacterales bacterium]
MLPLLVKSAPLAVAALAFAAGIMAGDFLGSRSPAPWLLLLGAVAATAGVALTSRSGGLRTAPVIAPICLVLFVFCAGGFYLTVMTRSEAARRVPPPDAHQQWLISGAVCSAPEALHDRWRFVLCPESGGRVRVEWRRAPSNGRAPVAYGEELAMTGRLARLEPPGNPWGFDARRYWGARHLYLVLYADGPSAASQRRDGRKGLRRHLLVRREQTRVLLQQHLDGRAWSLAAALLFGERGDMDPEVRQRFQHAGLAHVLAVSGLHVGVVVWLLDRLLRPAAPLRRSRFLILALVVAMMVVWTGGRAPVVRAGVMLVMLGLQYLTQRPPAPLNALGGAALILLLYHPYQLWDPGFGLSFSAVTAISVIRPARIEPIAPSPPAGLLRPAVWRHSLAAIDVGTAAFLGTAPLVMQQFGLLQPLSILLTPLALPLVAVFLLLGLLGLPLLVILPGAAPLLGRLLEYPAMLLDGLAGGSAAWFAPWVVPAPSIWAVAAYYGLLLLLLADVRPPVLRNRRPESDRAQRALAVAAGTACLLLWTFLAAVPWRFEAVFPDVGQGDGFLLGVPPGLWMLVDGGSTGLPGSGGAARYVLAPYLQRRGVAVPDLMVVTHAHADHADGISNWLINQRLLPQAVLEPGLAVDNGAYRRLRSAIARREALRAVPKAGDVMPFGAAAVTVLGPPDPLMRGTSDDINNSSLVLRVDYRHIRLLLTGDAHYEAEDWLLHEYGPAALQAHVLKAGHHGSRTSSTGPFLAAVAPWIAVAQMGRNNRYGIPHDDVIERMQARNTALFRSDTDGAVRIWAPAGQLCVASARSGGTACLRVEPVKHERR